ncbi:hypothetical protein B14911_15067 [Bacillus sp. NRRL B-14911]|uniref:Uncharacterized protein n=1 Tax=Bacillus infantis NRRL B-14911 TaxID=1367477 RepID=U5L7A2_9BACI|nr:hypothetical protein N288_06375 [Bacillus infantis NRRL B-14911]EAR66699.1 hypothetical protein B14911_15067 [Bacillus sp. NRRL B-14911]
MSAAACTFFFMKKAGSARLFQMILRSVFLHFKCLFQAQPAFCPEAGKQFAHSFYAAMLRQISAHFKQASAHLWQCS